IQSIFGNRTIIETKGQPPPVHTDYVKHIGYDEFEQKRRAVAGNDIETKYDYDPVMRRLSNVFAKSRDPFLVKKNEPARTFQDLRYQYDDTGNITEIRNDAPFDDRPDATLLVATTKYNFAYDDLYQLRRSDGVLQERKQWQSRYFATQEYNEIGNVDRKVQQ